MDCHVTNIELQFKIQNIHDYNFGNTITKFMLWLNHKSSFVSVNTDEFQQLKAPPDRNNVAGIKRDKKAAAQGTESIKSPWRLLFVLG